jgi:hypothetical protein
MVRQTKESQIVFRRVRRVLIEVSNLPFLFSEVSLEVKAETAPARASSENSRFHHWVDVALIRHL